LQILKLLTIKNTINIGIKDNELHQIKQKPEQNGNANDPFVN